MPFFITTFLMGPFTFQAKQGCISGNVELVSTIGELEKKKIFFFLCSNSCSSSGGSYVIKECLFIMIPPPQQGGDYCFSEGQAIPLFFAQTMVPSQKCLMLLLLSAMHASVNKDSCHKLGAEV